jgi:hypothetical protein
MHLSEVHFLSVNMPIPLIQASGGTIRACFRCIIHLIVFEIEIRHEARCRRPVYRQ